MRQIQPSNTISSAYLNPPWSQPVTLHEVSALKQNTVAQAVKHTLEPGQVPDLLPHPSAFAAAAAAGRSCREAR
jgi:hypothetical protein